MAGFKSAAHFSRMFKSAYGLSPKEYRANQAARDCTEADSNASTSVLSLDS